MYIFIDESGTFQATSKPHQVSCVTALVVPEAFARTLFRKFRKLIRPWRGNRREVKGSKLDEQKMAAVLKLLRRFDVLVIAVCVDMGRHTEAGIKAHKDGQVEKILNVLTPRMHPRLRKDFEDLASGMRRLSNQLYVQAVALSELVHHVLHASTLYYAQRIPKTLGAFKWRVDAKDVVITNYENVWKEIVGYLSQTKSLNDPLIQLRGADYSAFSRFLKTLPEPPAYLRRHIRDEDSPFHYLDLREVITKDLKFSRSDQYSGLQIADIVASAITRACNGTLQRGGWDGVGKLMPQGKKGSNSVHFILLEDASGSNRELPYSDFVVQCDREAKRIVTPERPRKP